MNYKLLFESLIKSTNEQFSNFSDLLKERYEISNIGEFLIDDYECLLYLKENFEEFVKTNGLKQPRKFLVNTLIEDLNSICLHLQGTKK